MFFSSSHADFKAHRSSLFCISNSPQKRHPERSASQIYRVTWRLMARSRRACPERSRGNPEGAYLTHAARSFSTTEARTWRTRHGLSLGPGRREKKLNLIGRINPEFKDFAQTWGWKMITVHEKMCP